MHVVERQLARLDEVSDDGLRSSTEEAQKLVDPPPLRGGPRDLRLEHERVADLFDAPDGFLDFEPAHNRLDGGVGGPADGRERLLDLADRRRTEGPERVHDLQLELREFWRHACSYWRRQIYYSR